MLCIRKNKIFLIDLKDYYHLNHMDNVQNLKKDIKAIKDKIVECRNNKVTEAFDIEMTVMTELPELYNDYPWLIKRLSKSEDYEYLTKFVDSLEAVSKGDKTLAAVELTLGMDLKRKFLDPVLDKLEKND